MCFSFFASRLGGTVNYHNKTYKIKKSHKYLVSLSSSALVAYVCHCCGLGPVSSFVCGAVQDAVVDKLLSKPGTYRVKTIDAIINPYDGASKSYTNYSYLFQKIVLFEKKVNGKWVTIMRNCKPQFLA